MRFKREKRKICTLAFDFFKTIHELSQCPLIKFFPTPYNNINNNNNTGRAVGLQPQEKKKLLGFVFYSTPLVQGKYIHK